MIAASLLVLGCFGFVLLAAAQDFWHSPVTQFFSNGPYYPNPSWDQQLPPAQHFMVLTNWSNQAVLDRETRLVWERQPVTGTPGMDPWWGAMRDCHGRLIAHRRGRRLPSYEELTSLLDDTQGNPALPAGHPFLGIGGQDLFWTATKSEDPSNPSFAYRVAIQDATLVREGSKDDQFRFWCVRGGSATANPPSEKLQRA